MSSLKRVQKEQKELLTNAPEGVSAGPEGDDLFKWKASVQGPKGTPYEGGIFFLDITFPPNYPFAPPKVKFVTKVFHPNVSQKTGDICLDILKDQWWALPSPALLCLTLLLRSPALSIAKVLLSIVSFLGEPNPDFHLEPEIGALFVSDKAKFEEEARKQTKQHAM